MQGGERPNGFSVTMAEKRGRRCVGLIYRRTSRNRTCGWRHLFLPTFTQYDAARLDEAYGNISWFRDVVRVYGVPRNIIAVYVPGQFSQVVRLYSCIIIPKVIFQKTHRLAKRILPRESVYFHLNYVHEYKFIYIRFIASDSFHNYLPLVNNQIFFWYTI